MAASSTTAGQIKYALPNDIHGLRVALAGGAFDTIIPSSSSSTGGAFNAVIPSASTFVASSSGTKQTPYHVFINHCGKDTKHTLATKIYNSLDATGLKVFLDKDELKYGDLLPKALEEAMASTSIYIAIFSEHYAESAWCLAELEYMVKTSRTIIPIFYHVDLSDVRWVKQKYAAAFLKHEEKKRYNPDVLQRWKEALHQTSFCMAGIINIIEATVIIDPCHNIYSNNWRFQTRDINSFKYFTKSSINKSSLCSYFGCEHDTLTSAKKHLFFELFIISCIFHCAPNACCST